MVRAPIMAPLATVSLEGVKNRGSVDTVHILMGPVHELGRAEWIPLDFSKHISGR